MNRNYLELYKNKIFFGDLGYSDAINGVNMQSAVILNQLVRELKLVELYNCLNYYYLGYYYGKAINNGNIDIDNTKLVKYKKIVLD